MSIYYKKVSRKAGTLQGESWLHYLKGKKREKKGRGEGVLVCRCFWNLRGVEEYLAYFNGFLYKRGRMTQRLKVPKCDKNEKLVFLYMIDKIFGII